MNDYQSVFGAAAANQGACAQLRDVLLSGGADLGSVQSSQNLTLLEQVTDAVSAVVYVRDLLPIAITRAP